MEGTPSHFTLADVSTVLYLFPTSTYARFTPPNRFFRDCLVRSVCRQYNELCDRSGQPGLYVVNFASMASKSSFISETLTSDRVGRQAMRCEAAESCNFRRRDALCDVNPWDLEVSGLARRAVPRETADLCGFSGGSTRCSVWNRGTLRFSER